jgi:hypothetical protein
VQIEDDLDTTAKAPEEPRQTNFKIRSVCGASGRRWWCFGDEGSSGIDGDQEGRRRRRGSGGATMETGIRRAAGETGIKGTSVALVIQEVETGIRAWPT